LTLSRCLAFGGTRHHAPLFGAGDAEPVPTG
jgi:hypothetical protein